MKILLSNPEHTEDPFAPINTDSLVREVEGDGPENAHILVLTDVPTIGDSGSGRSLSDYYGKLILNEFQKQGVTRSRIRVESICERFIEHRAFYKLDSFERLQWFSDTRTRLSGLKPNVIVALGELPLQFLTGKKAISKWHLSILEDYAGRKVIPIFHPEHIMKVYNDLPFVSFGVTRAIQQSRFPEIRRKARNFIIADSVDQSLHWIEQHMKAEFLSFDIETASGQILCIGFSTDPGEAICIPTGMQSYSTTDFYRLWRGIAKILGSDIRKVAQNALYDMSYLSRYGVRVRNLFHDTMVAQKFLHPEFPMGLDTVARLYTEEPYWKDEGKNWSQRQNIQELYYYNCKDSSVTLEAALAQMSDLRQRKLAGLFYGSESRFSIMAMQSPALQMSWTGLPVNPETRIKLREETLQAIEENKLIVNKHSLERLQREINPRSPVQVKNLLRAYNYKIPIKHGKETSDIESLMKLRKKYPASTLLTPLIQLSKENKKLSSYIDYDFYSDNRMRFSLYIHGTESGRWSGGKDPWNKGLNSQTIPSNLKYQFEAPKGKLFIEVDLKQAESRFVAYDGPVPKLIEMYRDGIDIHRFVASHRLLFNKPMAEITKPERQLGKKTGHAANYGMGAGTLADTCLKEMDLVLDPSQAQRMLDGYHDAFDGYVLRWQRKIEQAIRDEKFLRTPFGRERYFYGRLGPDVFKEAYAYRPQSTVADITNHLMLRVFGHPYVTLLNQVHDSLLMEVPENHSDTIMAIIKDQDSWNPTLHLPGGEMRIPIDIQVGRILGKLETVYEG